MLDAQVAPGTAHASTQTVSTIEKAVSSGSKPTVPAETSNRGKNAERNLRKKAKKQQKGMVESVPESDWRFQIRLLKGLFDENLRDDLLRDLNQMLYSLPEGSFTPSFKDYGLRFGCFWFSPDNQDSQAWLMKALEQINDQATCYKFIIEPYDLTNNRVSFTVPWDAKEKLQNSDILKRIQKVNPLVHAQRWRILKTHQLSKENLLVFCSIDGKSLKQIKDRNLSLNYGLKKATFRIAGTAK